MIEKISTANMTREEWLAERRKSIGGSDVGAILGLNQWRSPYMVYVDKLGLAEDDADSKESVRQGRDLEFYVAERFSELSGLSVRRCNYLLRNTEFPHLHANVDRLVDGIDAGLECKTASSLSTSRFCGGDFPAAYYAQCVSYMAVTGKKRWYLCVVILGVAVKTYQMTRIENDTAPDWCESSVYVSEEELSALGKAVKEFWEEHVEKQIPPDLCPGDEEEVAEIYRDSCPVEIDLEPFKSNLERIIEIKEEIKNLEYEESKLKAEVMDYMKEAERGGAGDYTVTFKTQTRESFDRKKFEKENPEVNTRNYINITKSRPFTVRKKEA